MYMPLGATSVADTSPLGAFTTWDKFLLGTGSQNPVVIANAGRAPDGTTTATRVQFVRGPGVPTPNGSSSYSILRKTSAQLNGPFTNSVYAALSPGAGPTKLGLRAVGDNAGALEQRVVFSITPEWKRLVVPTCTSNNGAELFDILLWDGMPETSLTADVMLWNPRSDPGAVPLGVDYTNGAGRLSTPMLLGLAAVALVLFRGSGR